MRILAIETASEACSVALFEEGVLLARDHKVLGRGHAEALIPMIGALPGKGKAGQILVSLGPGSFTGVRIGLASARALGFAWGAEVLGYPTLTLVAAMAREGRTSEELTVSMRGGHGEWFVQRFDRDGKAIGAAASLTPDAALAINRARWIAGSSAQDFAARAGAGIEALSLLPDAAKVALLDQASFTAQLSPIYGRAPDARAQPAPPTGQQVHHV